MLNFVKTAILLIATTQAIAIQAEANCNRLDWTIYKDTKKTGDAYLDMTPDSFLWNGNGTYDSNIKKTENGIKDYMS